MSLKGTNKFDCGTALFLAAVCGQTYAQFHNPHGLFVVPEGYKLAATFEATPFGGSKELFGFILQSDASCVVAFRGTSTFGDSISDAIARQTKFRFVRGAGYTHTGFTDLYGSARKKIMSVLRKLRARKRLYVTGHSLGGALATLCAIDAACNSGFASPFVYTFAAPRVGDPVFALKFDRTVTRSHRVYNEYDVVPHVPPILYKSPHTLKWYPYLHVKRGYRLSFRNGSVSANHALSSYFLALAEQDPASARRLCERNPGFCPCSLEDLPPLERPKASPAV
jgi:triacylglycerol lipase